MLTKPVLYAKRLDNKSFNKLWEQAEHPKPIDNKGVFFLTDDLQIGYTLTGTVNRDEHLVYTAHDFLEDAHKLRLMRIL